MTDFLVKHFIRDYEKLERDSVREAYGVLAAVVGILCNVLLFAVKAVVGLLCGSISVLADAFNNLSDVFSSVISLIGVKLAVRPADREHPFGHGRYEYIAAFIVAFVVIELGLTFAKSAVERILSPAALDVGIVSLVVLCLSVGVKLWMYAFNRRLGRRINSSVMLATSADALGDVLTTGATIVSLLIYRVLGVNADGFVGLAVAVAVMIAGINIARDTIGHLLGERPDPALYRLLQEKVESFEGILGTHDLIIHSYGPTRQMATIHVELEHTMELDAAHELVDRIERSVARQTGVFLVIHMDPVDTKDPLTAQWRARIGEMLAEADPQVTMHDFRLVHTEEAVHLVFDMVLPYSYDVEQTHRFILALQERVRAIDPRVRCVVTIDHSFGDGEQENGHFARKAVDAG